MVEQAAHCFRRFFQGVWVTGPMKFPSFIQEAPAASHMLSMLGLLDPASLHLATACVQVVALADAVKAKAMRTATAIGRRMGHSSESFDDRPRVANLVWQGCSCPPILVALPIAASRA